MSEGRWEQFLEGRGVGGLLGPKTLVRTSGFYFESVEKLLESIWGFIFIEKQFT